MWTIGGVGPEHEPVVSDEEFYFLNDLPEGGGPRTKVVEAGAHERTGRR